MEGEPGDDQRELAVGERQGQDVAVAPGQVRQALLGLQEPRALEHRGREVDAGDVPCDPGEGAGEDARPAGHVEHGVVGAGGAEVDDGAQRRLVADRRRRRERHRLARELIEDRLAMRVAHVILL